MNNENHFCEWCHKEHDGTFGSGRFCSKSCRSKYSSSKMKHHINNFIKHDPPIPAKGNWKCVWCGEIFRTRREMQNHKHEKHYEYHKAGPHNKGGRAWNKGLTKETNEIVKKCGLSLSNNIKNGKVKPSFLGKHHTNEFKQKQRENAIKQGLGGFNMRRGIDYNGVKLDSSYEVELAKSLDENNVKWQRCTKFSYHMNGKLHHYTPDFFLPDYNVYLDPKNDFLIDSINPKLGYKDVDKIHQVEVENNIRVIILNKDQLSWEFIQHQIDHFMPG